MLPEMCEIAGTDFGTALDCDTFKALNVSVIVLSVMIALLAMPPLCGYKSWWLHWVGLVISFITFILSLILSFSNPVLGSSIVGLFISVVGILCFCCVRYGYRIEVNRNKRANEEIEMREQAKKSWMRQYRFSVI